MTPEKDPGMAMLISTILPGGGQIWVHAFGSAFSVWISLLIVGAGAFVGSNMQDGAKAAAHRATSQEELDAAQADHDTAGNVLLWSWVLVVIVWAANIYDAKKEANKYNAKRATPPGSPFPPPVFAPGSHVPPGPGQVESDASSRLLLSPSTQCAAYSERSPRMAGSRRPSV